MLVLVQCTMCGRMETLDGFWAHEFLRTSVMPCMLTERCSGFVVSRHELCSRGVHHLARRVNGARRA